MITTKFETRQAFDAFSPVSDIKVLTDVEFHYGLELHHYQTLAEINPELAEKYKMLGWLMNRGSDATSWSEAKTAAREWAEAGDFEGCWVRIRETGKALPVEVASVEEDRYDMDNHVALLDSLQVEETPSGLLAATPVLKGKDEVPGIHPFPTDLYIARTIPA